MKQITEFLPNIHVFVCINDRTVIQGTEKPSCAPRINENKVKEIKKWLAKKELVTKVQVTKTKCLGQCHKEGSVVCVYPKQKFYKEVQGIEDIKKIIEKELELLSNPSC